MIQIFILSIANLATVLSLLSCSLLICNTLFFCGFFPGAIQIKILKGLLKGYSQNDLHGSLIEAELPGAKTFAKVLYATDFPTQPTPEALG